MSSRNQMQIDKLTDHNRSIAYRTRSKKQPDMVSMFERWLDDPTPISKSIEHPNSSDFQPWNIDTHYGMCGQSCPCCRAKLGELIGACTICIYS